MPDPITEVQAQLGLVADELRGTFFRLAGLVTSLPRTAQEASAQDLDEDTDRATTVRTAVLCVMTDHLQPAIHSLLAAASYRPEATAPAVADFLATVGRTFARREPETAGRTAPGQRDQGLT
jgi:hypothetical protein